MNENLNPLSQNFDAVKPDPTTETKPLRSFTSIERIFAWLSFVFGYLFCRAFPVGDSPFGGFLFVVILFVATAVVLRLKGCKFTATPIVLAVSAVAVCVSLLISVNGFIYFFAYTYALIVYCYFVYAVAGKVLQSGFSDFILTDFFKAIFLTPFFAFGQLFKGMFSGKAASGGKLISKVLLGIVLAIVPTAIVLTLLCYDDGFNDLLLKIFDFSFDDVFSHIFSLAFAIPIGMYIYGLFISSSDKMGEDIMTLEDCRKAYKSVRIAPTVTILVATVPVLLVYVIFFISQIDYYISGFTGYLPSNLSYSQYAREGFFQLCIVSVINLVMILFALLLMKRKTEKTPVSLKILTTIYCVFTLVLISTAISKMVMYIDYYGLTQKRVYATWFMILLAVIFIIIALKQFVPKVKAIASGFAVCVVLFAVLALSNVDSHIASYNVDRYLNGTLQQFHVDDMYELGDSAIPEMVRLYNAMSEKNENSELTASQRLEYTTLRNHLEKRAEYFEEHEGEIFSLTIPTIRARNSLRESGFLNKGE